MVAAMTSPAAKFVRFVVMVEHELVSFLIARVAPSASFSLRMLLFECANHFVVVIDTGFTLRAQTPL